MPGMNGERGLRDHLRSRMTNASGTCSRIFHPQTVCVCWGWGVEEVGGDGKAQDRAVFEALGRAPSPARRRRARPLPLPGRRAPRGCHSAGPRLPALRLTRTPGPPPPPPPPRLGLRPLKSQHRPVPGRARRATADPAAAAARRGPREELGGVCGSRSLGGLPARA